MGRGATLFVLWVAIGGAIAASQSAPEPVTAAQLQQLLNEAQSAHQPDDAVARRLAGIELAARVSPSSLEQLPSPGPKTTTALRALVDRSALLDPPQEEWVDAPIPDADAQKKMLNQALHYVAHALPALPNFLANRSTLHFNDTPMILGDGGPLLRGELHLVASSSSSITFRNGHESDGPIRMVALSTKQTGQSALSAEDASRSWTSTGVIPSHEAAGLETHGEFGPIMGIVLLDSAKGKISWGHWEKMGDKQVAVLHFAVDRKISRYSVQYCCVESQGAHLATGYHGSMTFDPVSGVIYRILMQADLHPDDPMTRAEMLVEYGPVTIGNSSYICPTRSISLSAPNPNWNGMAKPGADDARLLLNEVSYMDYHRFGSDTKLVFDSSPPQAKKP